jgi:hypothetical protein
MYHPKNIGRTEVKPQCWQPPFHTSTVDRLREKGNHHRVFVKRTTVNVGSSRTAVQRRRGS